MLTKSERILSFKTLSLWEKKHSSIEVKIYISKFFSSVSSESHSDIPIFRFIHPSITDDRERLQVHREIKNLVRTLPLPEICRYLMEMRKNNRVYLSVKPEIMFDELHRMGMPDESVQGFSQKNFQNYFNIND